MKNKTMTYGLFAIFLITVAAVITCGKQNMETEIHYPPAHMEEAEEPVEKVDVEEVKEELPIIEAQEPTSEAPVKVETPVVVPEVIPEVTPEPTPEDDDGEIEEDNTIN